MNFNKIICLFNYDNSAQLTCALGVGNLFDHHDNQTPLFIHLYLFYSQGDAGDTLGTPVFLDVFQKHRPNRTVIFRASAQIQKNGQK